MTRLLILSALVLLLAACGGQSSTTPPSAEIPTLPTPPSTNVPYYGEWAWTFEFDFDTDPFKGQISISQATDVPDISEGGIGAYQNCTDDTPCDGVVTWGLGLIGLYETPNGPALGLSLIDTIIGIDDVYTKMIGVDADGVLSTDAQGRETITGQAFYYIVQTGDPYPGTFTATKISDTPTLPIDEEVD